MTQAFARVDEHQLVSARITVPSVGPWWAEVVFAEAPDVSGRVSIWIGALALVGTIDASHDGVYGLQRRSRIVAGAGAWGTLLAPKHYHNDARIRARTLVEDAAREIGESLGDFAPSAEWIGIDYVRQGGPASRVLEEAIGEARWWVGYDGRTYVGTRDDGEATGYEVLDVDAAHRLVTLSADEIDGIVVGQTIDAPQLEQPLTIRELEIEVVEEGLRVRAWCGGDVSSQSRLVDSLRALVMRLLDAKQYGVRKYRVVRMSADRVELQAVERSGGHPDVLPISMWPGVAGAHAALQPGAEVLVEFIDGDRTQPIVRSFAGKDGVGHAPLTSVLSVHGADGRLLLGGPEATEKVSLADRIDARVDLISAALDAYAAAVPISNDGGEALQTALTGVWGVTPHESVDSGSINVRATRGTAGGPGSGF